MAKYRNCEMVTVDMVPVDIVPVDIVPVVDPEITRVR